MDIDLSSSGITDLASIQWPADAGGGVLNLANNNITSLSPISSLDITKLILNGNANLASLSGMPMTVQILEVENCALVDLTGISTSVVTLCAANNNISDVSALQTITGPTRLSVCDLSNNPITSFQYLDKPCTYLILNGTQISGFNGSHLIDVVYLELRYTPINSWSALDITKHKFFEIDITGTQITTMDMGSGGSGYAGIIQHDVPINIASNLTNATTLALQRNKRLQLIRAASMYVSYSNPAIIPGSGSILDMLFLDCAAWRRISGYDSGPSANTGKHAGHVDTAVDFNSIISGQKPLFVTVDDYSDTRAANSFIFVGSGPASFDVTAQLSIVPNNCTLYLMIVRNRTQNEFSIYDSTLITDKASLTSKQNSGELVLLQSAVGSVFGSGRLTLNTSDVITFYVSASRSMTAHVNAMHVSVIQVPNNS